jgi:methionine-rich copper-binding protein CopC
MHTLWTRRALVLLLGAATLLGAPATVSAHANLERSTPASGATVEAATI